MTVTKKPFNLAARPLAAAVTVAGAMLLPPHAQAVNVSQNGLGEVLLFPYYTVRNDIDTNINITNTSENTVVFKIRFRESHNSRDARDFNVVLSPFDVWNATVTLAPSGDRALLRTRDASCTAGKLDDLGDGSHGIEFTNFDYTSNNKDGGGTDFERTMEGHIEVIEMARLPPNVSGVPSPQLSFPAGSIGHNAQHVSGVPRDCDAVRTALNATNVGDTATTMLEPINVLKGSFSFLSVIDGKGFSGSPTTLANFFNPIGADGASGAGDNLLFAAESQSPGLNDAFPAAVDVIDNTVGVPVFDTFGATAPSRPVDAVSAALSRTAVANQYSVNPANAAKTDWVVSFPTKYFYVDERDPGVVSGPDGLPPFDASTTFQTGDDCAPVEVEFRFFDREEAETVEQTNGFSPPPPGNPANTICHETQVITFGDSNLFDSPNDANVDVDSAGFKSGWMRLQFPDAGTLVGETNGWIFTGLPVIGFAATSLENGTNGNSVLNYGLLWDHGYVTSITGGPN